MVPQSRFLNYAVSTNDKGHYIVSAEYTDGYELISEHKSKSDAHRALTALRQIEMVRRTLERPKRK